MNMFFGKFLISNKIITQSQLATVIREQKTNHSSLGDIAFALGYLSKKDISKILLKQWSTGEQFGKTAIKLKLLHPDQLETILKKQKEINLPLGELLVKKGFLNKIELNNFISIFKKREASLNYVEFLRNIPIFKNLSDSYLQYISKHLKKRKFYKNEIIYCEGEVSNAIFFIVSGMVEIAKNGTQSLLIANDFFGLQDVITQTLRREKTEAITVSNLLSLSWKDLHKFIVSDRLVSSSFIKEISDESKTSLFLNEIHYNSVLIYIDETNSRKSFIQNTLGETVNYNLTMKYFIIDTADVMEKENFIAVAYSSFKQSKKFKNLFLLENIDRKRDLYSIRKIMSENYDKNAKYIFIASEKISHEDFNFYLSVVQKTVFILSQPVVPLNLNIKDKKCRFYLLDTMNNSDNSKRFQQLDNLTNGRVMPNLISELNNYTIAKQIGRWINDRSIGLALGGGGSKCMAHLGVLNVLEQKKIVIDGIAGVSFGSVIAGLVSQGFNSNHILNQLKKYWINKKIHPGFFPYITYLNKLRMNRFLRNVFDEISLFQTQLPLFILSTNMNNGTEVIMKDCLVRDAICASSSLPPFLPMTVLNNLILGDGGMTNNVPASVLQNFFFDKVISVDVSFNFESDQYKLNSLADIIGRSVDILIKNSKNSYTQFSDIIICPKLQNFSLMDFPMGYEIIEKGKKEALEHSNEFDHLI